MKTFAKRIKKYLLMFFFNTLKVIFAPFIKIDKNIILLGTSFETFTDNVKYLYLYLHLKKNKNRYKIYFVTNNFITLKKMREKGLEAVKRDSLKCFILAMKARFYVFTHTISDVFYFKRKNCIAINLWHGSPIKRMGYDSNIDMKWIKFRKKLGLAIPYDSWDYFVVASENFVNLFRSCLKIKPEKIIPAGLPRNDVLFLAKRLKFQRRIYNKVLSSLGINKNESMKIILYAPTFRDLKKFRGAQLENINKLIYYFKQFFPEGNSILMIRTHPFGRFQINYDEKNVLDVSSYEDIQELLIATDILITDYSSVIFDYMILNRPIVLFVWDFDEYRKIRGEFYFNIYSLTQFVYKDPYDVMYNVKSILGNITQYKINYDDLGFNKFGLASKRIAKLIDSLK